MRQISVQKYFEKFCFDSRISCPYSICVACFRYKMWPLLFLWDDSLINVFFPTLTVVLIFILTINVIKYVTPDLHIPIRDTSKQHNWRNGRLLSKVSDRYNYLQCLSRENLKGGVECIVSD
jgi:hypothetical protein